MTVQFTVNGQACQVEQDDRRVLTEHLRDGLGLKGTRYGCGQERCGACVVLVDGTPCHSCRSEVGHLHGKAVTTVEALDQSEEGRVLLAEFERLQAAQCGFCLSGILVRALAFVRESRDGSREAIAQALDGHLCRCGAHPRILAAVQSAWQATRG